MNKNSEEPDFFQLIVNLFKRKKPVPPPLPSHEELVAEAKWINIKAKYSLEHLPVHGAYFVRYMFKNQWWYLRRWDEDYTLERVRGNAIRIPESSSNVDLDFDFIIKLHQEWINEGHVSLNYD